jgi:hypothetical protein
MFWLPSMVIHALRGQVFSALDVLTISIACPGAATTLFVILCCLQWNCSLARRASMFLLGVWMLGPASMTVAATFSGGGLQATNVAGVLLRSLTFFVSTPLMATYDGSLLALLLLTGLFVVTIVSALAARR